MIKDPKLLCTGHSYETQIRLTFRKRTRQLNAIIASPGKINNKVDGSGMTGDL
jgi:hypothetical protein